MFPFLYESFYSSLYSFLSKIVKAKTLLKASSPLNIDISEKSNLKYVKDIDVGYDVWTNMKKSKPAPYQLDRFQKSCQAAYQGFVKKILDQFPIKYKLTRGISCLDPEVISQKPLVAIKCLMLCFEF